MTHVVHPRNLSSETLAGQAFAPRPIASSFPYAVDTDGTLAANSDVRIATQKATKTYVDAAVLGAGGATAGMQIQFVYATSTATASTSAVIPLDGTKPQNTEGAALSALDLTITPNDGANILEAIWNLPVVSANGAATFIWAIFQDSDADAIQAGSFEITGGDWSGGICARIVLAAGSTSARTYKLRYGNASGARTAYVNRLSSVSGLFGGSCVATSTVREIKT